MVKLPDIPPPEPSKTLIFDRPLEVGRIVARPNRFIMQVEKDGETHTCHCPSTGKIGNLVLDGLPCLLSKSSDPSRKTSHTVEAISVNNAQSWIGINQNAANRYVEYFFRNGFLDEIAPNGHQILREQKVGSSKLDFKIENTYIEVKTPLKFLLLDDDELNIPGDKECTSFERFIRHLAELSEHLHEHERSALLTCFLYDAPTFRAPKPTEKNKIIRDAVLKAARTGVKMWQINMNVDQRGVHLLKYFEITYMFL
jgi:sugar fermentation stimulation protein A